MVEEISTDLMLLLSDGVDGMGAGLGRHLIQESDTIESNEQGKKNYNSAKGIPVEIDKETK